MRWMSAGSLTVQATTRNPSERASARRAAIYKAKRFSDHAPVIIDYDLKL